MKSRTIKVLAALAAVLLGAGVFSVTFWQATVVAPQEPEAAVQPQPLMGDASPQDLPSRLRIPSLGIDTNVQHVGVGKTGNMAVPTNYTDVGWYRLGTVPGFVGSAVMDGHVDNGLALPGVFKQLNQIKKGDELFVDTAGGATRRFVVQEVALYPYQEVPLQKLFSRADQARLNLVTCDGAWVQGAKTYDHRLVVYATLAS